MKQKQATIKTVQGRGAITSWVARVGADVSIDDVLADFYWSAVSPLFRRWDEITVLQDGDDFEVKLRITSEHPHFTFREIPGTRFEAPPEIKINQAAAKRLGLQVSHGGPAEGWRVLQNGKLAHSKRGPLSQLASKRAALKAMQEIIEAA